VDKAVITELSRSTKSGYYKYNNADFEKMVFDQAYREEILNIAFPQEQDKVMSDSSPKNIILFGPPGTGKTYNSIDKAVSIIDGTSNGHEANKKRYDELVAAKQVQFVTFHQSMSYEDFVEGIKPKTDDETKKVSYAVESGVFKMICNRAKEAKTGFVNFESAYNALVKEINSAANGLTFETQAQNKEFTVTMNSKGNFNVAPKTEKATPMVVRKEWIQTYLTTGEVVDWPSYTKPIAQRLVDVYGLKMTDVQKPKSFVLIIDEINRGNVSQIFGELITLIEKDKREGEKNAISLVLPYSIEPFSVPPNLYIIGTMNTADKSVEALDSALRRRFSFVEMPPKPNLLSPGACFCRLLWDYEKVDWDDKEYKSAEKSMLDLLGASEKLWKDRKENWDKMLKEGSPKDAQWTLFPDAQFSGINLQKLLNTINNRIEKLLDKDHLIGHSYFIDVRSEADLKSAFRDKIIPLLQEYFFGDFGKIGLVLGKSFIEMDTNSFDGFAEFDYDGGALSDLQERTVFRISAESNWDISSIGKSK
jgi:5-methylcytosine-specific restriction endonuclease McrBC GTP-binding regulatory subunit McrB